MYKAKRRKTDGKVEAKRPAGSFERLLSSKDHREILVTWLDSIDLFRLTILSTKIRKAVLYLLCRRTKLLGMEANFFLKGAISDVKLWGAEKDKADPDLEVTFEQDYYAITPLRSTIMIISNEKKKVRIIGRFQMMVDFVIFDLAYHKNFRPSDYVNFDKWKNAQKDAKVIGLYNISGILQKAIARGEKIYYQHFPEWMKLKNQETSWRDSKINCMKIEFGWFVFHLFMFPWHGRVASGILGKRRFKFEDDLVDPELEETASAFFTNIRSPYAPKHEGFSMFPPNLSRLRNIEWAQIEGGAEQYLNLEDQYVGYFATISAATD